MTYEISADDLTFFRDNGFLVPLPGLSPEQTAMFRRAVLGHLGREPTCERYELTDEVRVRRSSGAEDPVTTYEYAPGEEKEVSQDLLPFLFNVWKSDPRFLELGVHGHFGKIARQLLGADRVLFFEDNVVVKQPFSKYLPWHQDYSYWPLGEPRAVTFWIALDDIDETNGAMQIAPGTQFLGERLPVQFGSGQPFMVAERPGIEPVPADPATDGHRIVTYALKAGECGVHDALVWHGSTPNSSAVPRLALVLRYVAEGTLWLGETRIPYSDIGLRPGGHVSAEHFPVACD